MTSTSKSHGKANSVKDEVQGGLADQIKDYIEDAVTKYAKRYERIHDTVEEVSDSLVATTKKKPLLALGVAVFCGVLIGKILK